MQKTRFFYILLMLYLFASCSGEKPKIGDAVLYDYTVKQGDSVVFKSSRASYDTATTIIESLVGNEPIKQALMDNVVKLSVNDSMAFELGHQQKGFLHLYRIIRAADFPKYIENADKRQKEFEQELQKIGKELNASLPFYQSRRKAVLDSTIALTQQYKSGQLNDKIKTLPDGIQYYVVKGNGTVKPLQKKWVWFHYALVKPKNNETTDSYNIFPILQSSQILQGLLFLETCCRSPLFPCFRV